jgi:hypothetical protein
MRIFSFAYWNERSITKCPDYGACGRVPRGRARRNMCIAMSTCSGINSLGEWSTIHGPRSRAKMVSWWAICPIHDPSPIQSGRPVHEPVLTIPGTLTASGPLVATCLLPGPRPGADFTGQKKAPRWALKRSNGELLRSCFVTFQVNGPIL